MTAFDGAVLIDGANNHTALKALGHDIDYGRLKTYFTETLGLEMLGFYYFTTVIRTETGEQTIRPLLDWLDFNGYIMETKEVDEYTDEYGKRRVSSSMHVEFAVKAMKLAMNVRTLYLFTGNGDYAPIVRELRDERRIVVVSTLNTSPRMVSDDLRRAAHQFIELDDLARKYLLRDQTAHRPKRRGSDASS